MLLQKRGMAGSLNNRRGCDLRRLFFFFLVCLSVTVCDLFFCLFTSLSDFYPDVYTTCVRIEEGEVP